MARMREFRAQLCTRLTTGSNRYANSMANRKMISIARGVGQRQHGRKYQRREEHVCRFSVD